MIDLFIYCAGLVVGIVFFSWICELIENHRNNCWPKRVTADDIRELKRLFDEEGSFVGYNEQGEKFLVGYKKD